MVAAITPRAKHTKTSALRFYRKLIGCFFVFEVRMCLVMISQDLLDILVCPLCKKPLVLKATGESLKCGECRRVYPIQDDIPILLVDAATVDAS
jgi:uncharacterized protein YbaR (Trm112 family)